MLFHNLDFEMLYITTDSKFRKILQYLISAPAKFPKLWNFLNTVILKIPSALG